ncbi:MAG: glycosyltransferase family 39 protein [Planctomycetota bacterium]
MAALAGLYFAVAVVLLFASGALESDFSSFEDEPSHLASSLMVRDYTLTGFAEGPLDYAKNYYLHYPKVTIGHWPPMLPALLGTWLLALGTSSFAILSFFAVLATLIALLVYFGAREDAGDRLAALLGLSFLLLPVVQKFGHMVMTELPLTLFCTLAVLRFGRFLEQGRTRDSLAFGVFAAAGILTKGSPIFLALVPPVSIALSGRWSLLRRPALWGSAGVVLLLCAPWYFATIGVSTSSWVGGAKPSLEHAVPAAGFYARELLRIGGWVSGGLALVGFGCALGSERRRGRWSAYAAWVPSIFLCHLLVSTGPQARHLTLIVPVWLMAAALGARLIVDRLPRLALGGVHVVPAAVVLSLLPFLKLERKECTGHGDAARALLADESLGEDAIFLINSDSRGEGGFVASVALHEERPGHIVLRASKVVGKSDWMGLVYEPRFATLEELQAFLTEIGVDIVALDDSAPERRRVEHDRMLRGLIEGAPDRWSEYGSFDVVRDGVVLPDALKLYRQDLTSAPPRRELTFADLVGRELPWR